MYNAPGSHSCVALVLLIIGMSLLLSTGNLSFFFEGLREWYETRTRVERDLLREWGDVFDDHTQSSRKIVLKCCCSRPAGYRLPFISPAGRLPASGFAGRGMGDERLTSQKLSREAHR